MHVGILNLVLLQRAIAIAILSVLLQQKRATPKSREQGALRTQRSLIASRVGCSALYPRRSEYPRTIRGVQYVRWLMWRCAIWGRNLTRCTPTWDGPRFRPEAVADSSRLAGLLKCPFCALVAVQVKLH